MRKVIDATIRCAIIALMAIILWCVVWQVLSRYVVSSPSVLTEEVARFGLIWVGMLGMGYVTGQNRHLAIDLLTAKLPRALRRPLTLLVDAAVLTFAAVVLIYGGSLLVHRVYTTGQVSPILQLNMGWVYLAIPVSGLLVLYYGACNLLEKFAADREAASADA